MDTTESWLKIAADITGISFAENNIATIEIAGKTICIAKINEHLKAFSARCPHAGGNLCDGYLDGRENIVCPVHGYRFSVNTGADVGREGYFLKIYDLRKTEQGIFIKLA